MGSVIHFQGGLSSMIFEKFGAIFNAERGVSQGVNGFIWVGSEGVKKPLLEPPKIHKMKL